MDAIQNIMERVSVRQFSDKEISEENLRIILEAAMAGPSCKNTRDWSFIVVRDRETLGKMADANGPAATPLRNAKLGVLVCGDLDRSFELAPDYWVIDGSIATQNMILAANALGIGSVWLGTWPQTARVQAQAELFGLPDTQKPHSIIALGYPKANSQKEKMIWEEDRVHYEKW
jgi:nitroreductase